MRGANDWKFIPNAAYSDRNVLIDVVHEEQTNAAIARVRQAVKMEANGGTTKPAR